MYALLSFVAVFIIFVVCAKIAAKNYSDSEGVFVALAVLSGIVIVFFLSIIPINRYQVRLELVKLEAFQKTLKTSRVTEMSELERAAIVNRISEWNEKMAGFKYDELEAGWDLWIPDEIRDVKPIE